MNEYEAHLSSYDHTHKQRLKDMKAMVRDPTAGARARKAEAKADGIVSIKLGDKEPPPAAGAAFKKPGFKRSGFKSAFAPAAGTATAADTTSQATKPSAATILPAASTKAALPEESDTEDEGYQRYDPRFPSD